MGQLSITNDGMLGYSDTKSLERAVLITLSTGPKTVLGLIGAIRQTNIEFKHLPPRKYALVISDLVKRGYINSTYTDDFWILGNV